MANNRVGLIGWRGMVGSVLVRRMLAENDFADIEPTFFSTSSAGALGPDIGYGAQILADAYDIQALATQNVLLVCQGGAYTERVFSQLRAHGWQGYWIDAASTLRMAEESTIVLDPINRSVIDQALVDGKREFIGGNCTVSTMLMALGGLFHANLVESLVSMTYQSASGAGAQHMRELLAQMGALHGSVADLLADKQADISTLVDKVQALMAESAFPTTQFTVPLAGSLIPWIDREIEPGLSREEWKAKAETNKILGLTEAETIPVDGLCVRVGAVTCHSQAYTIKLKKNVPVDDINALIANDNDWVKLIANTREQSIQNLSPAAVSGTLDIAIGRVRKLNLGPEYLTAFSCGDQLYWGAAEPLRRMLRIVLEHD